MGRRLRIAALALVLTPAAAAADVRPPVRVASINMCTDQLLLDLAAREQIVGLSPFAKDTARSWAAARVGELPVLSGTAEEIMMLRPTHVLGGRFTKRATREFIRARGIPIEEFDAVRTVAQAREQIVRVGRLVGGEAAAATRVGELEAAMARLKAAASGHALRVLPLSRRGWSAGRDSLFGDLLSAAGLINAGGESGRRLGGFLSLEAIVRLRPDAILISREDGAAEDQGQAMLLHPSIQSLFPPERRIVIPESLTICGGPMLIEAMDRLSAQLSRLKPRDARLR
ncbi:MAG: ABC transporter substrate-binding protein [Beijerinckiaceae bacterium]